jgi:hypothetical protein
MQTQAPMNRIDDDLVGQNPYNVLMSSSQVIEKQLGALGLTFDTPKPESVTFVGAPLQSTKTSTDGYPAPELTAPDMGGTTPKPGETMTYNGPVPTGATLSDVVESYGAPSSAKMALDDVLSLFTLTSDLDEPVGTVLSGERLRGAGIVLVVLGLLFMLARKLP